MKTLFLFAILSILMLSCGSPKTGTVKVTSSKIDTSALPKGLKYKGAIDTAVRFTDNAGEFVVIASEDEMTEKTDNGDRLNGVILYAYCYKINQGKWDLMWKMQDSETECGLDVAGDFIPNTFAITDLNYDGKAEVWLMYHLACRGDVSPSDMKVIMHEGSKKYAIRGDTKVKVSESDYYGDGDYKFDTNFKNGPHVFRQYAQELWEKHKVETFGKEHPNGYVN